MIDFIDVLDYDPTTGELRWKERDPSSFVDGDKWYTKERSAKIWNTRRAGNLALNYKTQYGYLQGRVEGKLYPAHRVIWFLVHGEWPDEIDHINGNRSDNRLANLRNISRNENMRNRKIDTRNTSGFMGVSWNKTNKKWHVYANVDKKRTNIGWFETIEEAIEARKKFLASEDFHENHGRKA